MYHKLHRWSDEDEPVAVDTEDRPDREETPRTDDEPKFVIDYSRRIHTEDEY